MINKRFSVVQPPKCKAFLKDEILFFFITDHYFTCRHKSKNVGIRADYGIVWQFDLFQGQEL